MNVQLLTNAEFGALLPRGNCSLRVKHMVNGIEWHSGFCGIRADHYDTTPSAPQDAANMIRANGGVQDWVAMPVAIELPDGTWCGFGYVPRMHGSFIGGGNPGPPFRSLSNVLPAGQSWPENGGHCCAYTVNSTGGTTSATSLPSSNNRKVSILANQRALIPVARGAMSRAGAHEANIRSSSPTAAPETTLPVSGTWSVQVVAARDPLYTDRIIARLRGMGYTDAFRTKSANGWYQARVPAGTQEQARALVPVMVNKGFKDAFQVWSS